LPKKYSDNEKVIIQKKLKEEAMKCLSLYGIKKTTVDEIIKRVNIPKGTFYLFYESKELLLFDVINDLHNEVQDSLMEKFASLQGELTCEKLTDILMELYEKVMETGLVSILLNGDLEVLMRKLPQEAVEEHFKHDDFNLEQLFSFLNIDSKKMEYYSGAFRAAFMTLLYQREIGESVFKDALRLIIRGLVIQMFEKE
jgi:AcrR family transcriptional regulator